MDRFVVALARRGVSFFGARQLETLGRRSGDWQALPVNPIVVDSGTYLVAPRGETNWVRNARCHDEVRLRFGRRSESWVAEELSDEAKAAVLRRYLKRWGWQVGKLVDGVRHDADDETIAALAARTPVFRLVRRTALAA